MFQSKIGKQTIWFSVRPCYRLFNPDSLFRVGCLPTDNHKWSKYHLLNVTDGSVDLHELWNTIQRKSKDFHLKCVGVLDRKFCGNALTIKIRVLILYKIYQKELH